MFKPRKEKEKLDHDKTTDEFKIKITDKLTTEQ